MIQGARATTFHWGAMVIVLALGSCRKSASDRLVGDASADPEAAPFADVPAASLDAIAAADRIEGLSPAGDGPESEPRLDGPLPSLGNLANLPANDWVALPSSVRPLSGMTGQYEVRGWCTLRFIESRGTLAFYEGFHEPSRGGFCIYANALYEVDPRDGIVQQRSLSNWYCDDSAGYYKMPSLPDSPVNRHTYAQFAYVPTTDVLYMVGGAAARFALADRPYDFWRYSFARGTWEKMPDSYPGAEQDRAVETGPYTANLLHHPPTHSLYYFKTADTIHRFDLQSGAWSTLSKPPGAAAVRDIGAHGLYDPKRDRFAFYGNNWDAQDLGTNEFLFFDASVGAWQPQSVPSNGPPPKSYASLEYDSHYDVYLLHGGWHQNDTWVFDPTANTWQRLATQSAPPPGGTGTYVAYDPAHDALVSLDENKPQLYALRFVP